MHLSRLSFTAVVFGTLAGSAFAQVADGMICDATNDRVYRSQDLNGDNLQDDFNECVLFLVASDLMGNDSAPGTPAPLGITSVEARLEGGVGAVYFSSGFGGEADAVGRGVDVNGDGRIQADEMTLFWDAGGQGLDIDPDGLALASDGAVWVSSDFDFSEGVWRLVDTNADGVADTTDQLIDGNVGFTMGYGADGAPAGSNAATSGDDFQWLTEIAGGAVIGYEGFSSGDVASEDCIFRLEDQNGDGDLADGYGDGDPLNDEARLFLNYIGKNVAYPVNPDFGTVLRSPQVDPIASGGTFYVRLQHTAYQNEGGTDAYYFGSETSSTNGAFNMNNQVPSQGLNGLIYRGTDNNADNDVNDAGEITLFYDGSVTGTTGGLDKILGMEAAGGWLYVIDLAFGSKAVHRFQDQNADGDAMDPGEFELNLFDATAYDPSGFGAPRIPFTDPAPPVYSMDAAVIDTPIGFVTTGSVMEAGLFPNGNNWFEHTGTACSTFDSSSPQQSMNGVPRIDSLPGGANPAVTITASNTGSLLGDPLIMYGSTNATDYQTVPLPLDLGLFNPLWAGCSLYVNPLFPNFTFSDGSGSGSVSIGIPNDAGLIGANLYTQWLNLSSAGLPGQFFSLSGLGTFVVEF